jgi:PPOX class probable F420-dependent enzyme
MTPEQKTNILEILDRALDITVATVREDGYPQATTVSFVHDGETIYFGCDPNSQKARNIERSDKVSLTINLPYQRWEDIRGVSLGGRAHIVTDPAELQKVIQAMMTKFPQISDFAPNDREQLCIVRIDPDVISLLDYRKGFGHTEEIRV